MSSQSNPQLKFKICKQSHTSVFKLFLFNTSYFILHIYLMYHLSLRLPWLSIHIFRDQTITMKALKNCIIMQSGQFHPVTQCQW